MFSLPLKLAFKYFRSSKGGAFSFTSLLAVIGLSIGVSSLIIVMSGMNGFEKELQDRILGVVPHALIHSNKPISNYPQIINELKEDENIIQAAPYISLQGLISYGSTARGVSITGIDIASEGEMSILPDYMVYGSIAVSYTHLTLPTTAYV